MTKRCPSCGACQECGAPAHPQPPQVIPMPYPVPRPYPYPVSPYPGRPYYPPIYQPRWTMGGAIGSSGHIQASNAIH